MNEQDPRPLIHDLLCCCIRNAGYEKIDKVYGREMYTALVGAPGQAMVYVFEYDVSTQEWNQAEVRNHDISTTWRSSRMPCHSSTLHA